MNSSDHNQDNDEELLEGGKVMSIWDHLTELRTRLVRSLIFVVILFVVALPFSEYIIHFLKIPLVSALPEANTALHFTGPMDAFMSSLKVCVFVSIILGCPIWLWQMWKFFEPALYPSERKYIAPFAIISVLQFFLGVFFAFYVILPIALEFLISFGLRIGTPIITINDYLSLLSLMVLGFGFVFEAPVLLVLLALLDLVDVESLTKNRGVVVVVILVMGAMFTPPDPFSQVAMAGPLYLMFELSILLIKLLKKKKNKPTKPNSQNA